MCVIEYPRSAQSSFVFVFAQRIGEQSAGVGPPGCLGIAQPIERLRIRLEALDCRRQCGATF
jgi:hypothetical protein